MFQSIRIYLSYYSNSPVIAGFCRRSRHHFHYKTYSSLLVKTRTTIRACGYRTNTFHPIKIKHSAMLWYDSLCKIKSCITCLRRTVRHLCHKTCSFPAHLDGHLGVLVGQFESIMKHLEILLQAQRGSRKLLLLQLDVLSQLCR